LIKDGIQRVERGLSLITRPTTILPQAIIENLKLIHNQYPSPVSLEKTFLPSKSTAQTSQHMHMHMHMYLHQRKLLQPVATVLKIVIWWIGMPEHQVSQPTTWMSSSPFPLPHNRVPTNNKFNNSSNRTYTNNNTNLSCHSMDHHNNKVGVRHPHLLLVFSILTLLIQALAHPPHSPGFLEALFKHHQIFSPHLPFNLLTPTDLPLNLLTPTDLPLPVASVPPSANPLPLSLSPLLLFLIKVLVWILLLPLSLNQDSGPLSPLLSLFNPIKEGDSGLRPIKEEDSGLLSLLLNLLVDLDLLLFIPLLEVVGSLNHPQRSLIN
jgi:hypothetical protein